MVQLIQDSGIKYTCKIKPHSCPLHDQGPVWELQLKQINAQLAAGNQTAVVATKLRQRQRELTKKVSRYELHLKQYAVCRDALKAAEDALRCGDRCCVVYRDFVNMYNDKGNKVKNLVLVKITRGEDGELIVTKLHNFSTDSKSGCDAYYVADVFRHHLTPAALGGSGMFDDIDRITLGGDHGPHFASIQTMWDESTFHARFGKTLTILFLCSYHAYNRCDGAGVCVKTEAEAAARNNCGPISADDYATLMNESNHSDTFSFTFDTINRSVDIFPRKLCEMPGVKKFCDIVFIHADVNGTLGARTAGVVRARLLPGMGEYQVFDLVAPPTEWGKLCKPCTHKEQRPVYHTRDSTKCAPAARGLARSSSVNILRANLQQPGSKRLSGQQVPLKRKIREKEGVVKVPMLVPGIKAALLALKVPVSEYTGANKMKKGQLFDFLQRKREEVAAEKDDVDAAVDVGLEESAEEVPDSCAQRPRAATRQSKRRKLTSSGDDDDVDDASRAQPVVAVAADVVASVVGLRARMQAGNITFPSRSC